MFIFIFINRMTMDAEKSWNERIKEKKHSHKPIMYNCMVLVMTLAPCPDWRIMFSVLLLSSLVYNCTLPSPCCTCT
jgi:hypothetical protein